MLVWIARKTAMRAGFPANSAMQSKSDFVPQTQFLMPDLPTLLDARQPLYRLAQTIDWKQFETAFGALYAEEGRPALPIRRMVGLLLLKQLHNLSDERVVEQWTLNPYFQFFCGEREFRWGAPRFGVAACDPRHSAVQQSPRSGFDHRPCRPAPADQFLRDDSPTFEAQPTMPHPPPPLLPSPPPRTAKRSVSPAGRDDFSGAPPLVRTRGTPGKCAQFRASCLSSPGSWQKTNPNRVE